jgi:hypothetical protein
MTCPNCGEDRVLYKGATDTEQSNHAISEPMCAECIKDSLAFGMKHVSEPNERWYPRFDPVACLVFVITTTECGHIGCTAGEACKLECKICERPLTAEGTCAVCDSDI